MGGMPLKREKVEERDYARRHEVYGRDEKVSHRRSLRRYEEMAELDKGGNV